MRNCFGRSRLSLSACLSSPHSIDSPFRDRPRREREERACKDGLSPSEGGQSSLTTRPFSFLQNVTLVPLHSTLPEMLRILSIALLFAAVSLTFSEDIVDKVKQTGKDVTSTKVR